MLIQGVGGAADPVKGVEYLQLSAGQGSSTAQALLGWLFEGVHDVPADLERALSYAKGSADAGDAEGRFVYGRKLILGVGIAINFDEGLKYLQLSADQGRSDAAVLLARVFEGEHGGSVDLDQSLNYARRSADSDDVEGLFLYGRKFIRGTGVEIDIERGLIYLRRSADQGYLPAQIFLAGLFQGEYDGPVDLKEAAHYARLCAESGNAHWQTIYGAKLISGDGVTVDYAEALKYLTRAADQENALAQALIAMLLEGENGLVPDLEGSLVYASRSAQAGNEIGEFCYGRKLVLGRGITIDIEQGLKYVELSADHGYEAAREFLAEFFAGGFGGPIDHQRSMRYVCLLAKSGSQRWQDAYVQNLRNEVTTAAVANEGLQNLRLLVDEGCAMAKSMLVPVFAICFNRSPDSARLFAESGDSIGQWFYGKKLVEGDGVPRDFAKGMEFLHASAAQGFVDAQYEYGYLSFFAKAIRLESSNWPDGLEYIKRAATAGHAKAIRFCAFACFFTCKDDESFMDAVRACAVAGDLGDDSAYVIAAGLCCFRQIDELVELEGALLRVLLGKFNEISPVVWMNMPCNSKMSLELQIELPFVLSLLKTEVDNGNPRAQLLYAFCQLLGFGIPSSRTDACLLLRSAADQKEPRALAAFVRFYRAGTLEWPITRMEATH
jgi:TPR repeat protein